MDALMLSRLQFTATTIFHFLFVPLTLGLSVLVAIMETRYARTGDEIDLKMTRFWGKLFLINFAVGVVTGITLEFQFGTNWSGYSAYVGDIFGSLLAIEATAAFFLESTLIGVWVFGWNRLSRKAHATVMWLVAGASNLSAIWILTANGWMQHPVGFAVRNGRAELTDFAAVVFNPFSLLQIFHVIPAAFLLTAFFIMGISAYHLLKRQNVEFFTRSFRLALVVGAVATVVVTIEGDLHAKHVTKTQPAKLAAMEALWDTTAKAPVYLMAVPDEANERNSVEIGAIPGLLSFLGHGDFDAKVKGLKEFPREERPPVVATFLSFRVMIALVDVLRGHGGDRPVPQEPAAREHLVPQADAGLHPAALPGHHHGMGSRGDRQAAVDRVRGDADRGRGLPDRCGSGRAEPGGLHPGIRAAGRGRLLPDRQGRGPGAGRPGPAFRRRPPPGPAAVRSLNDDAFTLSH